MVTLAAVSLSAFWSPGVFCSEAFLSAKVLSAVVVASGKPPLLNQDPANLEESLKYQKASTPTRMKQSRVTRRVFEPVLFLERGRGVCCGSC